MYKLYDRQLAISAAYYVLFLGVILGVKIVYKHTQKIVDTQNYAHCSKSRSVLCKKSIATPCKTRNATGTLRSCARFYNREQLLPMICLLFENVTSCNGSIPQKWIIIDYHKYWWFCFMIFYIDKHLYILWSWSIDMIDCLALCYW